MTKTSNAFIALTIGLVVFSVALVISANRGYDSWSSHFPQGMVLTEPETNASVFVR